MTAEPMTPAEARAVMAEHADHGADGCYPGSGLHSMGQCLPYRLAAAYVEVSEERDETALRDRIAAALIPDSNESAAYNRGLRHARSVIAEAMEGKQ